MPRGPGNRGAILPNDPLFCGKEFVIPNIFNSAAELSESLGNPLRDTAEFQKLAALRPHCLGMIHHHLEERRNLSHLTDALLNQVESGSLELVRLRIFRFRLRLKFVKPNMSR